jgi:predicted DNA-binding transcriptional regulator AlpA
MRTVSYSQTLTPSVDYLERQGRLLIDSDRMADFLGVESKVLKRLVYTDRIPLPVSLGLGKCLRWSVIELLEWVEAGCPRRREWIAARGQSGWYRYWRTKVSEILIWGRI